VFALSILRLAVPLCSARKALGWVESPVHGVRCDRLSHRMSYVLYAIWYSLLVNRTVANSPIPCLRASRRQTRYRNVATRCLSHRRNVVRCLGMISPASGVPRRVLRCLLLLAMPIQLTIHVDGAEQVGLASHGSSRFAAPLYGSVYFLVRLAISMAYQKPKLLQIQFLVIDRLTPKRIDVAGQTPKT
jgi:hypothetical protein